MFRHLEAAVLPTSALELFSCHTKLSAAVAGAALSPSMLWRFGHQVAPAPHLCLCNPPL